MAKLTEKGKQAQKGLVISWFGSSVAVEADNGQVIPCKLHRNQALPVVGDRVLWQMGADNTGLVLDIEPRSSLLARHDARSKSKAIAANVDHIIVVMAPPPVLSEYLIDRYLIAADMAKIKPVIVLNKADLLNETLSTETRQRLNAYERIPYPVVMTSVYQPESLDTLNACFAGKTAVLVGPSGVGKSSIISALAGNDQIRVGEVSAKGTGKHTTTATRLYHLPQGSRLIDSPGVREFNLGAASKQDILRGFKEFDPYLKGCKFRDCAHCAEPGCAVQMAVTDGKISPLRYAHYLELIKNTNNAN